MTTRHHLFDSSDKLVICQISLTNRKTI